MHIAPTTIKAACRFIAVHHRHHKPPVGALFAIGLEHEAVQVGVIVVGRPVARMLDGSVTCEVTRCCTNGIKNGCSMLYAAAWRAAKAMGYRRLVTYTLPSEGGASLIASGMKLIGEAGGGSWDRESRPRTDSAPTETKLRWEYAT